MKTEIIESNKMIAEFMGAVNIPIKCGKVVHPLINNVISEADEIYNAYFNTVGSIKPPTEKQRYFESDLLYHKSWDWLMPVVEKIDTLGYDVEISRISCSISPILSNDTIASLVCGDISKKIEVVYEAVIQFIKWQKGNIEK